MINNELLQKLEKLSAITISKEKREETIKEIGKIVDFVENLNELDLDNKNDHFSTIDAGTPFREDKPSVSNEIIESILSHAPKTEGGFFVVPKIID